MNDQKLSGRKATRIPASANPRQEMMTVDQVAALLNVHTSTIYRMLKRAEIPAFKLGSDWRFSRQQIYKWIAQRHRLESTRGQTDGDLWPAK